MHCVRAGEIISVHPGDDTGALYGAPPLTEGQLRPRAAFVVLARSQDVDDVVVSMTRLLARYNNSATQCVPSPLSTCASRRIRAYHHQPSKPHLATYTVL